MVAHDPTRAGCACASTRPRCACAYRNPRRSTTLLLVGSRGGPMQSMSMTHDPVGRRSTDAEGIATRVGYGASAILNVSFAVTAISLARTPDARADGNRTVNDITTRLMQHTPGRWVVGLIGLTIIGAGLYRFWKGMKSD